MLGIVVLILALAFAPGLKQAVEVTMNTENFDCGNSSISSFDKVSCTAIDLFTFEYVASLIFIALSIITGIVIVKVRSKNE